MDIIGRSAILQEPGETIGSYEDIGWLLESCEISIARFFLGIITIFIGGLLYERSCSLGEEGD